MTKPVAVAVLVAGAAVIFGALAAAGRPTTGIALVAVWCAVSALTYVRKSGL